MNTELDLPPVPPKLSNGRPAATTLRAFADWLHQVAPEARPILQPLRDQTGWSSNSALHVVRDAAKAAAPSHKLSEPQRAHVVEFLVAYPEHRGKRVAEGDALSAKVRSALRPGDKDRLELAWRRAGYSDESTYLREQVILPHLDDQVPIDKEIE